MNKFYSFLENAAKWVEGFGYVETKIPSDPYLIPEMRINNMYPYTFEQTIKVTHHSKPKRRDAARKWNNNNI